MAFLAGWLVLVAVALPGTPSWKRSLLEATLILAGVFVAVAPRVSRVFLAAAPRAQLLGVTLVLAGWFFAQVRDLATAGFPIVAWQMYADPRRDSDVVTYRLHATDCAGRRRPIGTGEPLGVAIGRTRLNQLHAQLGSSRSGEDSIRAAALLDSTLYALLQGHNRWAAGDRWCRIDLERLRVTAAEVGGDLHPRIELVRYAAAN